MSELVKRIRNWTIGIGIVAILASPVYSYYFTDNVRTVINETQVKWSNGEDKYLVFTDSGVFENTDVWYRFKFRSSDLQNKIMKLKGKEVTIEKYGWRFGPLSWYENIVDVEGVK